MRRARHLDLWSGVTGLTILVVGLLLVYPLGNVFQASFLDNETGRATLDNYAQILGHRYYRNALWNSVLVGLGGMLGAVLFERLLEERTKHAVVEHFGHVVRDTLNTPLGVGPAADGTKS